MTETGGGNECRSRCIFFLRQDGVLDGVRKRCISNSAPTRGTASPGWCLGLWGRDFQLVLDSKVANIGIPDLTLWI